jgi:hypothetical protein
MQLQTATKKQQKARIALQGPSGAGKTYSALLMAYGLCSDWGKIVLIDSERGSGSLCSHLGNFSTIQLSAPYTPEKFSDSLELAAKAGKEVIILDSLSSEWDGWGGILQSLSAEQVKPNGLSEVLPRHHLMMYELELSPCHLIATLRTKEDYVVVERNGKQALEKVGLKPIQNQSITYDFNTVLNLDMHHKATASKDRTGLFAEESFQITVETGARLLKWCMEGERPVPMDLLQMMESCATPHELDCLLVRTQIDDSPTLNAFIQRRQELEASQKVHPIPSLSKYATNGNNDHRA